jgi:hypothetical protein
MQHDLIEQRGAEIKVSKAHIDSKDAAVDKARCAAPATGQQADVCRCCSVAMLFQCTSKFRMCSEVQVGLAFRRLP